MFPLIGAPKNYKLIIHNKLYISQSLEKHIDLSYQQNHSRHILLENKNVRDKHVKVPENSCQSQDMP